MAAQEHGRKPEIDLSDLLIEVRKLDNARSDFGKNGAEYIKHHKNALKMINFLNTSRYKGFMSLSKTRAILYKDDPCNDLRDIKLTYRSERERRNGK
jgi:hypothetical protein